MRNMVELPILIMNSAVITSVQAAVTTTTVCTGAVTNPKTKAKPKQTSVGQQAPSFITLANSLKPKPWHLVKKRGIIPDGLVQTHLNHFRKLTNGGSREEDVIQTNLCSMRGLASVRAGT